MYDVRYSKFVWRRQNKNPVFYDNDLNLHRITIKNDTIDSSYLAFISKRCTDVLCKQSTFRGGNN